MKEQLLQEIVNQFGVTQEFVWEYFRLFPDLPWKKGSLDEFLNALSSLDKMYFLFAFSTVIRGRYTFGLLESYGYIRHKGRYLDIGTAYAGFLRAFRESGFKEAVGIELQERLVRLGKANISDLDSAQIVQADFVREDFSHLGLFDVITCNDVIEHVDNPVVAFTKMAGLLTENGCLILEIPNRDYIDFVISDGHFQIFGIAQLDRDAAAEYYAAVSNAHLDYRSEMGEMYPLWWYIDQLTRNGLTANVLDTHYEKRIEDCSQLIANLKDAYIEWRRQAESRFDSRIVKGVSDAVNAYIQQIEADFALVNNPIAQKRFENKYLRSFWTIVATKSPPPAQSYSNEIEYLNKQIVYLQNQISQIQNSMSWKVTRPFRFLRRFMLHPRQAMKQLHEYLHL
ncbi:MAG TPA: class I SAM-dependent methyltransferase [Anaerolineales bacterium]|nr:class I SAM-dependent methyltransferase [Anaerolineales bacterium]